MEWKISQACENRSRAEKKNTKALLEGRGKSVFERRGCLCQANEKWLIAAVAAT